MPNEVVCDVINGNEALKKLNEQNVSTHQRKIDAICWIGDMTKKMTQGSVGIILRFPF